MRVIGRHNTNFSDRYSNLERGVMHTCDGVSLSLGDALLSFLDGVPLYSCDALSCEAFLQFLYDLDDPTHKNHG